MGPSVKFVSRINGSFSKKVWVNFLFVKTPNRGGVGVVEGGFFESPHFLQDFFIETFPKSKCLK